MFSWFWRFLAMAILVGLVALAAYWGPGCHLCVGALGELLMAHSCPRLCRGAGDVWGGDSTHWRRVSPASWG